MRIGRNFAIWDRRCYCGCNERVYIWIVTHPFQLRWFMDAGYWFLYLHIGRKWWRWSSAGYLREQKRYNPTPPVTYKYTLVDGNGNETDWSKVGEVGLYEVDGLMNQIRADGDESDES